MSHAWKTALQHAVSTIAEPKAARHSHLETWHGEQRDDPYHWLRDRNWPVVEDAAILAHIEAENCYTDELLKPVFSHYQSALFEEIKGRIALTDRSAPIFDASSEYFYYTRTESTSAYPIHARRHRDMTAEEEVILDVNCLAEGRSFCDVHAPIIHPTHRIAAYGYNWSGDERYHIAVITIANGQLIEDAVSNCSGDVVWHEQIGGFFYVLLDEHWRATRLYFHRLGTTQDQDSLLWQITNPEYHLRIWKTASKRYLCFNVHSLVDDEVYIIPMNDPTLTPHCLCQRYADRRYEVDHRGHQFYIRTNDHGVNFRIAVTDEDRLEAAYWQTLIPHHPDIYLADMALLPMHYAVLTKQHGLAHITVYHAETHTPHHLTFEEVSYDLDIDALPYETNQLRIRFSSPRTPETVYDYAPDTQRMELKKRREIPSGHHPDDYEVKRLIAPSADGTLIPVTVLYHKEHFRRLGAQSPLYLYGYGSYGIATDPHFNHHVYSLVNRGFVYAIAHIRGGSDVNYQWYTDAKFHHKQRTFDDFIAAALHVIDQGYTRAGQIAIMEGSAGGMLVGAVINQRPDLFKAAVAHVPFVDVLSTMLDETLPLTPGEFNEWGNPKLPDIYATMKAYSPYDQITHQDYPALYVTAGLHDPRVTYWEPAKWVAKLRAHRTNPQSVLCLRTHMGSGHFGATDRFEYWRELAEYYSFILAMYDIAL